MKVPNSRSALKVYGIPFMVDAPQPSKTEATKQIEATAIPLGIEKKNSFILLFFNASVIVNKTIMKTKISNGLGMKVL